MLDLRKIAVTGGLACGKSEFCSFLKMLGAYVVSADEIVHQLLSSKTKLSQKIINLIGFDIVVDGQISRSLIAKKVFNQPRLLQGLEEIIHPAVFDEIKRKFQLIKEEARYKLFVVEIPLLYETGFDSFFDAVVAVIADPEICKKRFKENRNQNSEDYNKRSQQQMSPSEKAARANYVIQNNGSLEDLKSSAEKLYKELIITTN